jgi:hypothetical protein
MPSEDAIVDEKISLEGEEFYIALYGFVDEDAEKLMFTGRIVDLSNDEDVGVVQFKSTITNPIVVLPTIIVAAKLYGLCVVGNMVGSIGKIIYQEYNNSCREEQGLSVPERYLSTYNRVKRKHGELKAELVKSLLTCLPKTS